MSTIRESVKLYVVYSFRGRICKPLKRCIKFFHYKGNGVCYNDKYGKKDKKNCDNFDKKRELHQMLTAVASGGQIMCGLNSLSNFFFCISQVLFNEHILHF